MNSAGTLVRFRVEGDTVYFLDAEEGRHRADSPEEVMRALRAIQAETGEADTTAAPPESKPGESWLETIALQAEGTFGTAYGPLFGRVAGQAVRNGPSIADRFRQRRMRRR